MSKLSPSTVGRIARRAVDEHRLPLEVVAVIPGGGSSYAEIVVNHAAASGQFTIGIFRDTSEAGLRREVDDRLLGWAHAWRPGVSWR